MPAESKSQQRLFGMVRAYQRGELQHPPDRVREVANHISKTDTKHFAETKHEGLPEKKEASHTHCDNTCPGCGDTSTCRCSAPDKEQTRNLCMRCKNQKEAWMDRNTLPQQVSAGLPSPGQVRSALLYPINAENKMHGIAAGAAYGMAAGAGLHAIRKIKRFFTGEPEPDDSSIGKSMLAGGLAGGGITTMAQIPGQNPYNEPKHASGIEDAIMMDQSLPSWKQMQLLQQLHTAESSGIHISPEQLAVAGLSALAGWLIGQAAGFGTAGSALMGAAGGFLGNALSKPNPGDIIGQGYYRP